MLYQTFIAGLDTVGLREQFIRGAPSRINPLEFKVFHPLSGGQSNCLTLKSSWIFDFVGLFINVKAAVLKLNGVVYRKGGKRKIEQTRKRVILIPKYHSTNQLKAGRNENAKRPEKSTAATTVIHGCIGSDFSN